MKNKAKASYIKAIWYRKVVWGKGEIVLDSMLLQTGKVVWSLASLRLEDGFKWPRG